MLSFKHNKENLNLSHQQEDLTNILNDDSYYKVKTGRVSPNKRPEFMS